MDEENEENMIVEAQTPRRPFPWEQSAVFVLPPDRAHTADLYRIVRWMTWAMMALTLAGTFDAILIWRTLVRVDELRDLLTRMCP